MARPITGISSMATRQVLAELSSAYTEAQGTSVSIESVGGVEAARRVQAGEAFDLVFLAAQAIDQLLAQGHLLAGSKVDLVHSGVAIAVRAGAPRPAIGTEAELRSIVLAAASLSYSTGPSGVHLAQLFERWGMAEQIRNRIVQAPPGVPVGSLVARGEVELGFQQLSELMHLPGIEVLGPLPPEIQILTTFSGAIGAGCAEPGRARAVLDFMASPAADATKRRHGMQPA